MAKEQVIRTSAVILSRLYRLRKKSLSPGEGKGTTSSRAAKLLRMYSRFSACGELLTPPKSFSAASLAV
jgi:hypothetical protein